MRHNPYTELPAQRDPRATNPEKHGLTSEVIRREEQESFDRALEALKQQYQPQGVVEAAAVRRLAALTVRLERARRVDRDAHAMCYSDAGVDPVAFEHLVSTIDRYERAIGRALAKTFNLLGRAQKQRDGEAVPSEVVVEFLW